MVSQIHCMHWNQKVLTEAHALAFCDESGVRLLQHASVEYGRYVFYKRLHFIIINPCLAAGMRLWVLWHEIAHFLYHSPQTENFSALMLRRQDHEANWFAAVAMMPKPLIAGKTIDEVVYEFGYPKEIVQIRYDISERDGI